METLTISRFLKGILRKEFQVQDVVKTNTKAVEIYIGRQDIAPSNSSQRQSGTAETILKW